MEILAPKYQLRPNDMVHTMYVGVAHGNKTVSRVVKPAPDGNSLMAFNQYGEQIPRGEGGRVGVFVLGGMVTTLDEMRFIAQAKMEKKFVPRHNRGEIVEMCRVLQARRNEQIEARQKYLKANPSEAPKAPKKKRTLLLPVGFRWMPTSEPGLSIAVKV